MPHKDTNNFPKLLSKKQFATIERNLDAIPIWKPVQYRGEERREVQLPWIAEDASVVSQKAGSHGNFIATDKLTLAVLHQMWKDQGTRENGLVNFQIGDILERLEKKDSGENYRHEKSALFRLRGCLLEYRNSFFDAEKREWLGTLTANALNHLFLVEPKLRRGSVQLPLGLTQVNLNLPFARSLLGRHSRTVNLKLLTSLSETGILLESYVDSVLFRNQLVRKDIFGLFYQLGLSTKGKNYGSDLKPRVVKDLRKITDDSFSRLGDFSFEKSKTNARSLNVVLVAKDPVGDTTEKVAHAMEDVVVEDILQVTCAFQHQGWYHLVVRTLGEENTRACLSETRYRRQTTGLSDVHRHFAGQIKDRCGILGIDPMPLFTPKKPLQKGSRAT
jgi:hypothetical protein